MKALTQQIVETNIVNSRELTECNLRKQLAYLYRIFDFYGWSDLIVTHLSVKIPKENSLLILPFGLSFDEVTPDNLVKVDFDGTILESPLGFKINQNGTMVHRAIYRNLPKINCILHTHSNYGVAVSNLAQDMRLLDQISMIFYGKIGYHNFEQLFINDDEQTQLLQDMANNNAMILKNHGLLTVGQTIAEAFWFHYYLEKTCKVYILTASSGNKIHYPSNKIIQSTATKYDLWRNQNVYEGISNVGDSELLFDAAKRKVGYIFN